MANATTTMQMLGTRGMVLKQRVNKCGWLRVRGEQQTQEQHDNDDDDDDDDRYDKQGEEEATTKSRRKTK
jgi:hypothetical protein